METCNETDAKFMAESLLNHAKEICRYARTYFEPGFFNLLPDEKRQKFIRTVERMIREMNSLMLLATFKGVHRFCNQEQIEAYMDEARLAITTPASVRQSAPILS